MIINCAQCGKEKTIRRERLKPKNYCSKACTGKARQRRVTLNCKGCSKPMVKHLSLFKKSGDNLFCNRECHIKFQVGPNNPKYVYVNKQCQICDKEIPHERAVKTGTKCCSKECKIASFSRDRHYLWRGGVSFEPYPREFTKQLKDKIKSRDNHQCQGCGITDELLAVHHIDSDKKNCSEENLITTCQKCNNSAKRMRDYWINFYKFNLAKRGFMIYEGGV